MDTTHFVVNCFQCTTIIQKTMSTPLITILSTISYLSKGAILSDVDYDFSVVTIGHLIATINQLQATTALQHDAQISIKFHKSLKLLGVKEIVNLMEVCKRK
eukprot:609383_1